MNRQELLSKIREITNKLDLSIDSVNAKEVVAAAKAIAKEELDALQVQLKDNNKMLAYFYGMLVDSDEVSSNTATVGYLQNYAEGLLKAVPALEVFVNKHRQFPKRLLKYLMLITSQSLSEMVRKPKIENIDEEWLDPITGQVMDIPVTFYLDGKPNTLDLFTLLHNSNSSFGLRTPTRQYVYLTDLYPNIEIVRKIFAKVKPILDAKRPLDDRDELIKGLEFIRNNDLNGLKNWYIDNEELNINQEVADQQKNGTLLHYACSLNYFDIAIWLLNHGAFAMAQNGNGQLLSDLLDVTSLERAIADDQSNYGLIFLKAMSNYPPISPPKDQRTYYANLELAAEKNYVPAMLINGTSLCGYDNQSMVIKGIKQLRASLRMNSGLAVEVLYEIYDKIIARKPVLQSALDNSQNIAFVTIEDDGHINVALRAAIEEGDKLNRKTLIRDLMAVLASDVFVNNRSVLEKKLAIMLQDQTKSDRSNRGYDRIKALCYANKANSSYQDQETLAVLLAVLTSFGLQSDGRAILEQMNNIDILELLNIEAVNQRQIINDEIIAEAVQNGAISVFGSLALRNKPY